MFLTGEWQWWMNTGFLLNKVYQNTELPCYFHMGSQQMLYLYVKAPSSHDISFIYKCVSVILTALFTQVLNRCLRGLFISAPIQPEQSTAFVIRPFQSRTFWLTWGLFSAVVDCYWSGTSVKRIVWLPPSVCLRTQRGSIWTFIRSVDLPEKHNTMIIYTAVSTRNTMHLVNVKWSLDLNYAEWNATETQPWLVLPKSWMNATR